MKKEIRPTKKELKLAEKYFRMMFDPYMCCGCFYGTADDGTGVYGTLKHFEYNGYTYREGVYFIPAGKSYMIYYLWTPGWEFDVFVEPHKPVV